VTVPNPTAFGIAIAILTIPVLAILFVIGFSVREWWRAVPIGTRSVLVGVHQFLLHPLFIAIGWYRAYGFRGVDIGERTVHRIRRWSHFGWHTYFSRERVYASLLDPRLWFAFFVHDLGYLGKPNMDGAEGETHPELGANLMRAAFGPAWGDLVLLHSRYYAKKLGRDVSPLCIADKWVIVLEPSWLYLPRVWLTGEHHEFVANAAIRAADHANLLYTEQERADWLSRNSWRWHRSLRTYMRRWINEHKDGKADNWTRVRHHEATA
jgi:hypothetical protein